MSFVPADYWPPGPPTGGAATDQTARDAAAAAQSTANAAVSTGAELSALIAGDPAAATAIGTASFAPTGLSSGVPLADWMGGKAVDLRNEGCKCDGTTDDAAALQAAIDKWTALGGALFQLPRNRTLLFGKSPVLKPGIWIEGHGPGSVLKNTQTHANVDWRDGPWFGDGHPYTWDARNDAAGATFARYPISDLLRGADTIVPTGGTAAAALAALPVGAFCWVRAATEYLGAGWSMPIYSLLTYVVANDGTNITLADEVEEDVVGAYVSPISGTDPSSACPWQVTGNNVLRNLAVDARCSWGNRGSAYGVRCEDISLPKAVVNMLPSNAFQHALLRRVRGRWNRAMLEVAMASKNITIEECRGKFEKKAGQAVANPIKFGENSKHLKFVRSHCSVGTAWDGSGWYTVNIQDVKDAVIESSTIRKLYAGGGINYLISIQAGNSVTHFNAAQDIQLNNNVLDIGPNSMTGYLLCSASSGNDVKNKNITIQGNRLYGTLATPFNWILAQFTDGLIARGNFLPASAVATTTGSTNVSTGTNGTDNMVTN